MATIRVRCEASRHLPPSPDASLRFLLRGPCAIPARRTAKACLTPAQSERGAEGAGHSLSPSVGAARRTVLPLFAPPRRRAERERAAKPRPGPKGHGSLSSHLAGSPDQARGG